MTSMGTFVNHQFRLHRVEMQAIQPDIFRLQFIVADPSLSDKPKYDLRPVTSGYI